MLLFAILTACSGQPVKDDSPASDLLALKANAERDLKPRTLPNGKLYCFEDSTTEGKQDTCTGDLEDTLFKSEQDKARGLAGIIKGIERLMLQRNPCGFFRRIFQRSECRVE